MGYKGKITVRQNNRKSSTICTEKVSESLLLPISVLSQDMTISLFSYQTDFFLTPKDFVPKNCPLQKVHHQVLVCQQVGTLCFIIANATCECLPLGSSKQLFVCKTDKLNIASQNTWKQNLNKKNFFEKLQNIFTTKCQWSILSCYISLLQIFFIYESDNLRNLIKNAFKGCIETKLHRKRQGRQTENNF